MNRPSRDLLIPGALSAVILAGAVALVAMSLRQPESPSFARSVPDPSEVGQALDGPRVYTVDAGSEDRWHFFDFSVGSEVERPGPLEWDLAFRRFHVIANGGDGFAGSGGIIDMGDVPWDSIQAVSTLGYATSDAGRDSINTAVARWYDYGFSTHVLSPKGHAYAVRTADGRYAKMEILSYYCLGAQPGCVTIRYVYQGDGSPTF